MRPSRSWPLPALLPLAAAAAQPASDRAGNGVASPPPDALETIVVTARPGPLPPLRDAIDYFRLFCFEANRLTGRSAAPEDRDWQPLDSAARERLGIADPQAGAFGLADRARRRTLLLKIERIDRPGRLVESRCTLIVIGGDEHARLASGMAALFRGPGTQRHVGEADGVPSLPGWRQWLWTGMPARGSRSWRVVAPPRGSGPTSLVVTDLRFYDQYDFLIGDLKTRDDGRPLSILSFAYTTRAGH
ncbi:MAG: hypothetical protein E6G92_05850 [Alphaproteobacteria bacterium]|nr:MAG: hypothetical protein E6G92_05850 [Alphaproteobacteria bacterium]